MFCATLLVSGQCLLVCGGSMQEFKQAWNWPASFRWENSSQALVDDYGTLPQLHRRGDEAIWSTPAEPTSCAGEQRPSSIPKLKAEQLSLAAHPKAFVVGSLGASRRR
jgi:hypothetical protein